jgi:hypothetical protein
MAGTAQADLSRMKPYPKSTTEEAASPAAEVHRTGVEPGFDDRLTNEDLAPLADVKQHASLGLSLLGWGGFLFLWVLQALVLWNGMETIKRFIDFAGPAVYLVMFLLAAWMLFKTGWKGVGLTLGQVKYRGWDAVPVMLTAISLVVSYFCTAS